MSFGVSVYGNGGMNTSYSRNISNLFGTSPAGINLTQLFIAPTVAWKLSDTNAVGVSLNIARDRRSRSRVSKISIAQPIPPAWAT